MKPYKEHLVSTKSYGEKISNTLKPVYRTSAIFPVFQSADLKTRILYMGYWFVKRGISNLGLLVSLRDEHGALLYRRNSAIDSAQSYEIPIDELLEECGQQTSDFLGSIELEIFSSVDLVFPYPALVVNYYNEFGSGVVHTTGRVYNDFEDLQNNSATAVKECGFDVLPGAKFDPFFTFVNGHLEKKNAKIEVEIVSESGNREKRTIKLGNLAPLQTVLVRLKNHINVDEILDGSIGTAKIDHDLEGFFPRFIAGNFCNDTHAAGVTHTYYDNSGNRSESDYWENQNPETLHDSAVFVPLFIDDDWYTELKLYPIYSPSTYTISLRFHDIEGRLVGELNDFMLMEEDVSDYRSIDFGECVERAGLDRAEVAGAYILKSWNDKQRIPARLKYGLNIGRRQTAHDLPTNICFNSSVSNAKVLEKQGTFKWLPIVNHGDSLAVVQNASFVRNYDRSANLDVSIYKAGSSETISRKYELAANAQLRLTVDKEIENFLCGNAGWMTIKADSPFVTGWYFEFNASGIMGGDHAF